MTCQPSPSHPIQPCGRAVADPRGTGYRSQGVVKETGWWTSCAGQNEVVQPSETWTGTGNERDMPGSKSVLCHCLGWCFILTLGVFETYEKQVKNERNVIRFTNKTFFLNNLNKSFMSCYTSGG